MNAERMSNSGALISRSKLSRVNAACDLKLSRVNAACAFKLMTGVSVLALTRLCRDPLERKKFGKLFKSQKTKNGILNRIQSKTPESKQ
jgi:hypothetical protein